MPMQVIVIAIVIVFFLLVLFAVSSRKAPLSRQTPATEALEELPYRKKELLTKAEYSLYKVLGQAIGNEDCLFAKVGLSDLVDIIPGTTHRQAHFNRIRSKHVDFVLCNRRTVSPVLAIELDDSSHREDSRKERDVFVDELFRRVGLPLVRIPVKMSYSPDDLAKLIREGMDAGKETRAGPV